MDLKTYYYNFDRDTNLNRYKKGVDPSFEGWVRSLLHSYRMYNLHLTWDMWDKMGDVFGARALGETYSDPRKPIHARDFEAYLRRHLPLPKIFLGV